MTTCSQCGAFTDAPTLSRKVDAFLCSGCAKVCEECSGTGCIACNFTGARVEVAPPDEESWPDEDYWGT